MTHAIKTIFFEGNTDNPATTYMTITTNDSQISGYDHGLRNPIAQ